MRLILIGWMFGMMLLVSCFKTNQHINPSSPSILQFIAKTPSLSILNAAINRVQLDTAMSSGGPFTFFAPNDSAMKAAGLTLDSVNRMDPHQLLLLLEYAVVNGRVSADALPGFLKAQFTSLHPVYEPFISKNYYGIFINGIGVTDGNNVAGDGIVQVIGGVPIPPVGAELDILSQHPDLTYMASLARHCYMLNLLMANPSPLSGYNGENYTPAQPIFGNTVLVPTDSAWRAFGYPDTTSFYSDSLRLLTVYFVGNNEELPLLEPYFFTGFVFTCDLKGQFQIEAPGTGINYLSQGFVNAYMITSQDGMSFTGNGIAPGNPVRIIGPDIIAANGVIQKINQVFQSHL